MTAGFTAVACWYGLDSPLSGGCAEAVEGDAEQAAGPIVTSISPGYVRTELADSIDDPATRAQIRDDMARFAIAPEAVARAIAFAIEQPADVEIGDMTIRPTRQG